MIENKHTVYTQGYILVFRSALEQRTKNRKQQEKTIHIQNEMGLGNSSVVVSISPIIHKFYYQSHSAQRGGGSKRSAPLRLLLKSITF